MSKIYSYILRFDDGAAPNPFSGTCTLAICKPAIRRTSQIGDWIVGTGSKNAKCNDGNVHDLSGCLVYAMKITSKLSLLDYDSYCEKHLPDKIPQPDSIDWKLRMGDCIYYEGANGLPEIRPRSIHDIHQLPRDISGIYALLSSDFYYFGENAVVIPQHLRGIIKKNQGHLKIENPDLLAQFEQWIRSFKQNMLYGNPQLQHVFDSPKCDRASYCSKEYVADDDNDLEENLTLLKC